MKIVIAPDSFKESLTAKQVAQTIENAFRQHLPSATVIKVPMADGGEGTSQSLIDALAGQWREVMVSGPLGTPVLARYGLVDTTPGNKLAVIEMAEASGLHLVNQSDRNPAHTCSRGTGELIVDALNQGANKIILGLGGSATNDAGTGMLTALGVRFLNEAGQCLPPGGLGLSQLAQVDVSGIDARLADIDLVVACDVDNPLIGEQGASAVFGPQKGADARLVQQLDAALAQFALVVQPLVQREFATTPGAGAAGGMGAALLAFSSAKLQPGIDIVSNAVGLAELCAGADIVVTGEGRIDGQSIAGKTPVGVARIAKAAGAKVVIGIAGCLGHGSEKVYQHGIDALFDCVTELCTLDQQLEQAEQKLSQTSEAVARFIASSICY